MTLHRCAGYMLFVGVATWLICFGILSAFSADHLASFLNSISAPVASALFAAWAAGFAMFLVGAAVIAVLVRQKNHVRTAIDTMSQGVCMFDGSERLVICNSKYYEMYGLTAADAPPGVTLSQVLARRTAKGTFSRDPVQYRQDLLSNVRKGVTTTHEVTSSMGKQLLVMNHPVE